MKPKVKHLIARSWRLAEAVDVTAFERLMRDAEARGLVRTWDDGRGQWPWYEARRGKDERALHRDAEIALGATSERPTKGETT